VDVIWYTVTRVKKYQKEVYIRVMSKPAKLRATDADPSANRILEMEESIAGVDAMPDVPNDGIFQLVKHIREAENHKDEWSPIIESELRFLKAALKLLMQDPLYNYRFGTSLQGAMKLVGILKARAAERDAEERLDKIVDNEILPKLPGRLVAAGKTSKDSAGIRPASSSSSSSGSS
jgi:hypothetical protein